MAANKTDANDADGLAHLAEVGFYREVRVKGFDSMLMRTLISGRRQLMKMRVQMSNQIHGLLKTFGLVVPKGAGSVFERNAVSLLDGEEGLARIILPLLKAWSDIRLRVAELTKQLVVMAGKDQRLPFAHIGAWRRHGNCHGLCCSGREFYQFQELARRWRMGWTHAKAISIRRG